MVVAGGPRLKKLLATALMLALGRGLGAQESAPIAPASLEQAADLWQATEHQVRDSRIGRGAARADFVAAGAALRKFYRGPQTNRWFFPLVGYGGSDFEDSSYKPKGFDYYRGTRGGARHPAVDIFVKDRLHRGLDDHDNKPILVRAAFSGVVVSVQQAWRPGDRWRGGVYAYVMEPATGRLAYYAHLSQLSVDSGQPIKRGEVIGRLGRTGKNAWKERSDTHLHFMWMVFHPRGSFDCLNPIARLRKAQTLPVFAAAKAS
jgi:murein DD-endopeptidase MepM/ murein hydrolase activator NlpD